MAVQEVRDDGRLQEINRAQGRDWGGNYVDAEFKHMLEDIISKPVMEAFRVAHTMDYIDLFRSFERRTREHQTRTTVTITVPPSLLEIVDDIDKHIEDQGLTGQVKLKNGKFQIALPKYETFFNKVIDKIVVKVEEMLVSDSAKGTNVIIMVGGFSESEILQKRIRRSFPSCKVVIPPGCGLAVLKGAVLYGHDPDIIAVRMMKYTYGVGIKFIKGEHPESKNILINGKEYFEDKFYTHVKRDTLVHYNEEIIKIYYLLYENQKSVNFKVVASDKEDPQYTDEEGCREIGSLTLSMPDTHNGTIREVIVKIKFGATKLTFELETSKHSLYLKLDYLGDKK